MFYLLFVRRRLLFWRITLIFILTLLPFANAGAKEILIGTLLPLSGPLARVGFSAANALQLAMDQINSEGGVRCLRMPMKLEISDWGTSPTSILDRAVDYESKEVPILIGTGASSATLLASRVADKFGLPLIDCSSILSERELDKFNHTFALSGTMQQFVVALGDLIAGADVLLAYEDTDWGLSVKDSVKILERKGKIRVIDAVSVPYLREDVLHSIFVRLKSNRKAVLLQVTSGVTAVEMMRYLRQSRGFKPYGWVNMAAIHDLRRYVSVAGKMTEGMLAVSPYFDTLRIKGNEKFVGQFMKRFGERPDSVAGMFWNGAWLVKDVLERARSIDRGRIMAAIRQTDLQAGINNIYLTGGIKFDRSGRNIRYRPPIIQIQKMQPEVVWPHDYQTRKWIPFPVKPTK